MEGHRFRSNRPQEDCWPVEINFANDSLFLRPFCSVLVLLQAHLGRRRLKKEPAIHEPAALDLCVLKQYYMSKIKRYKVMSINQSSDLAVFSPISSFFDFKLP